MQHLGVHQQVLDLFCHKSSGVCILDGRSTRVSCCPGSTRVQVHPVLGGGGSCPTAKSVFTVCYLYKESSEKMNYSGSFVG